MSTISGNECWYFIDLNLNHTFFDETKKEIHQMWGSKNRLKPQIQNVLVNWSQRESDEFFILFRLHDTGQVKFNLSYFPRAFSKPDLPIKE